MPETAAVCISQIGAYAESGAEPGRHLSALSQMRATLLGAVIGGEASAGGLDQKDVNLLSPHVAVRQCQFWSEKVQSSC